MIPHRTDTRPLLIGMVLMVSVLVHVVLVVGGVFLFPETTEPLAQEYTIEPLQLVEDDEKADEEQEQVVSLDKPDTESEPPEETKYADRYNQKTEKETVRKRDNREPGAPTPTKQPAAARPPTKPVEKPAKASKTEKQPKPLVPGSPARAVDDLGPVADGEGGSLAPSAEGDGDTPTFDPSQVVPNMGNTMGQGGTGIADYLDIDEGEKDILNRKEVRYWAFFDRLKEAIRRQWRPNSVYRSHDPRGQVYGVADRLTILRVTLDGSGELHDMSVERSSGLDFMDNEALRAFRAAQPYSNPPEALKDEEGLISFKFGFFFEIHSRGGRLIRYR